MIGDWSEAFFFKEKNMVRIEQKKKPNNQIFGVKTQNTPRHLLMLPKSVQKIIKLHQDSYLSIQNILWAYILRTLVDTRDRIWYGNYGILGLGVHRPSIYLATSSAGFRLAKI